MTLNQQELPSLEDMLPTDDNLLFKQPSNDLELPDFSNLDDMDFGDLEFLDLATVPVSGYKRSSQLSDLYFNSLATPSGYCSANFLIEESNRLSSLMPVREPGDNLDKSLLDNLEDLFGTQSTEVEDQIPTVVDNEPADVVYEVPSEVLNLMAKNFENLENLFDEKMKNDTEETIDTAFKQITIKSIKKMYGSSPPPESVAKIVIKSSKKDNYTRFTFSSLDDKEKHSFQVDTSNLRRATKALRPMNLDSLDVIRKLLKLGPKPPGKSIQKIKFENGRVKYQLVPDVTEQDDTLKTPEENPTQVKVEVNEESSLKGWMLEHGIHVENLAQITVSGQKFLCCPQPNCQKAYSKAHELKLHLLGHYNIKPYHCPEPGCSWGFVTQSKLTRHLASHNKTKYFTCGVEGCCRQFTTVYNLNTHLKLHNRLSIYPCKLCDQKFQTLREQQVHTSRAHSQTPAPLACPRIGCSKCYFTKSTLDAHIKGHDVVIKTVCNVCGKDFNKPSKLKEHMMFHTGDKPFACEFPGCAWRFPTSSKLSRHRKTHTNDKRFQCNECDKTFGRLEHLTKHKGTHNRLSCPQCGKILTSKSALTAHVKGQCDKQGDLGTSQLDFVALLSSVDEEVITTDSLNCPEYEISTEMDHIELRTEETSPFNLNNKGEGPLLQLVQVEGQDVHLVPIEDCQEMVHSGVDVNSTVLLPDNMTEGLSGVDVTSTVLLPGNMSSGDVTSTVLLPDMSECLSGGDITTSVMLPDTMSEGLATLDTSAISHVRPNGQTDQWTCSSTSPSTINLQDLI